MLVQFKFKNHKCFYEETILDLTATQEKRHIEDTINVSGINILPVVSIHGANASGKTSILDALIYMFNAIYDSINIDIERELPQYPFEFSDKAKKQNSEYEITLVLDDNEYRYGFAVNKNEIAEEWLYTKRFTNDKRVEEKPVFERRKREVNFAKKYNHYEKIWKLYSDEIYMDKLLIISHIARKDEKGFFREIFNYIRRSHFELVKISKNQINLTVFKENSQIEQNFTDIVKEIDPNLLRFEIEREDGKVKKISGVHRNIEKPGEECLLPIELESHGTIKVFNILPMILISLREGGLMCIDELDMSFHPLLYRKIINMYKDKKINQKNAQLIFTTHSTFMFNSNEMRRDQLYLVEKNEKAHSRLYSLSEFRELRVDADYEKRYLSGQFGAIPFNQELGD